MGATLCIKVPRLVFSRLCYTVASVHPSVCQWR